ncbi:MAG: ThiF family adenylyltransferase [Betaproteobacteria bacterium]|nr:ThiF family adenylyltransferase [Betaproteobacteria bacterium]
MPIARRLENEALLAEIALADVVLDYSDNFPTRYAVNLAAARAKKPLISGAAIRFSGQLAVFELDRPDSPCYHCLFPEGEGAIATSATVGVFAPLAGLIGCMQAGECLKLIAGMEERAGGRFWRIDFLAQHWQESRFTKDPECAVCGR